MAEDKSGKGEGQGLHMLHAQASEKMGQANAVTEHGHAPTSEKMGQTKAAPPNTVHCHQGMGQAKGGRGKYDTWCMHRPPRKWGKRTQ